MKVTYYAASSLDGFIAKPDGDLSWLDELNISPEASGYDAFFESIDGLVMGRATYDFIVNYGQWPYGDKPVWVCTHQALKVMDGCNLQNGKSPQLVVDEAKASGVKHLWLVGGGMLAASFFKIQAPTYISVSQMPIILGQGIKLFADLDTAITLRKVRVDEKGCYSQLEFVVDYD